jgi:hypothetical protein
MSFLSLLSPTSIMAGIIVALTLSNAFFINRWSAARDNLTSYTASVNAAQEQIEADIQRRLRESAAINTDTAARLDFALASLRSRPSIRVQSSSCKGGMPGLSAAPGLAPQATAAAAADTGIVLTADQCAEKLGDGIEDAVRFAWLQDWVVQQHGINQ